MMLITNILKRAGWMKGSTRDWYFRPLSRNKMSYIIDSANIKFLANLPQPHLFNGICILFEIVINMCTQLLTSQSKHTLGVA